MVSRPSAFLAFAATLFVSASAGAHSLLINPTPLTNDDNAKSGPCGCYFGAAPEDPTEDSSPSACPASGYPVTDLVAGQMLQVTWKETINHTGKFRVSISTKPIDQAKIADLEGGVVYEAADTNSVSGGLVSATIIVPDTPCTNCVLQMRQLMDAASTPYYYSCAAINITSPSGTSSSSSSSTTGAGGAGGTGGMGGNGGNGGNGGDVPFEVGAGPAPIEDTQASGYCSVSPGSRGSSAPLAIALAALCAAGVRRRRDRV